MLVQFLVFITLAGYGPWTSIGPEGGDINAPVQSPTNAQELWALSGTNPTQVVHSTDAGETWESLSSFSGSTPYDMIACPNGDLVAAGSSRTWTSTNGGVSWTPTLSLTPSSMTLNPIQLIQTRYLAQGMLMTVPGNLPICILPMAVTASLKHTFPLGEATPKATADLLLYHRVTLQLFFLAGMLTPLRKTLTSPLSLRVPTAALPSQM